MSASMIELRVREEGNYIEPESGAIWVSLEGDGFANSDADCCECGEIVGADEACFLCLDGGEVAHEGCVTVMSRV